MVPQPTSSLPAPQRPPLGRSHDVVRDQNIEIHASVRRCSGSCATRAGEQRQGRARSNAMSSATWRAHPTVPSRDGGGSRGVEGCSGRHGLWRCTDDCTRLVCSAAPALVSLRLFENVLLPATAAPGCPILRARSPAVNQGEWLRIRLEQGTLRERVTRIELAYSAWEAARRGWPDRRLTSVFPGRRRFSGECGLTAEPRSRPLFPDVLGTL